MVVQLNQMMTFIFLPSLKHKSSTQDLLLGFQAFLLTAWLSWSSHKPQMFHNNGLKPTFLIYCSHKSMNKIKGKTFKLHVLQRGSQIRKENIFAHVTFTIIRIMHERCRPQRNRGREKRYFSVCLPILKEISTF